jgi:hypothetical protein
LLLVAGGTVTDVTEKVAAELDAAGAVAAE